MTCITTGTTQRAKIRISNVRLLSDIADARRAQNTIRGQLVIIQTQYKLLNLPATCA